MSGKYLLDTNIVIALLNEDKSVLDKLREGLQVSISSISIGELYFGAQKSRRKKFNTERIEDLVVATTILPCDYDTAKYYGKIKNLLKSKGKPIPENDIWIAAIVAQHRLVLVTRDKHFKNIEKIAIEEW